LEDQPLQHPGDLVNITAHDTHGVVVLSHGGNIRGLKQAVDLAISIVEQLDLAYSVLIKNASLGYFSDGVDHLRREYEIVVKVHKECHAITSLTEETSAPTLDDPTVGVQTNR
jgi:hypothetical protein